jgi:THO complex subunit 1
MALPDLHSVDSMTDVLEQLLRRARQIKRTDTIEPPLPVAELIADSGLLASREGVPPPAHNAIVETAARNLMYNLLVCQ